MKKGFSLVEIMVVITIVGILVSILIPQLSSQIAKSKISAAQATESSFTTATQAYFAERGTYPCVGSYGPGAANGDVVTCLNADANWRRFITKSLSNTDPWGTLWIWYFNSGTCNYIHFMSRGPNAADDSPNKTAGVCAGDDICIFLGRPCDLGI